MNLDWSEGNESFSHRFFGRGLRTPQANPMKDRTVTSPGHDAYPGWLKYVFGHTFETNLPSGND